MSLILSFSFLFTSFPLPDTTVFKSKQQTKGMWHDKFRTTKISNVDTGRRRGRPAPWIYGTATNTAASPLPASALHGLLSSLLLQISLSLPWRVISSHACQITSLFASSITPILHSLFFSIIFSSMMDLFHYLFFFKRSLALEVPPAIALGFVLNPLFSRPMSQLSASGWLRLKDVFQIPLLTTVPLLSAWTQLSYQAKLYLTWIIRITSQWISRIILNYYQQSGKCVTFKTQVKSYYFSEENPPVAFSHLSKSLQ